MSSSLLFYEIRLPDLDFIASRSGFGNLNNQATNLSVLDAVKGFEKAKGFSILELNVHPRLPEAHDISGS
jgi:hypothetical protein